MFYTMYLDGLCKRRQWPAPHFHPSMTRQGYTCVVRVNNREYSTDGHTYTSEALARDAAATRAYMICRNFSVNDGMFPGQKPGDGHGREGNGTVQGMPVAIGVGRKGARTYPGGGGSVAATEKKRLAELREEEEEFEEYSWMSGGSSPRSIDSAVGGLRQQGNVKISKVQHHQQQGGLLCACRRAVCLARYERCQFCLRDAGWLAGQSHGSSLEWESQCQSQQQQQQQQRRWQKRG